MLNTKLLNNLKAGILSNEKKIFKIPNPGNDCLFSFFM
jgi:hypothetical protein